MATTPTVSRFATEDRGLGISGLLERRRSRGRAPGQVVRRAEARCTTAHCPNCLYVPQSPIFNLSAAASVTHGLARDADRIYTADPRASGRHFARLINSRPESHVAVLAASGCRLVAYNLALEAGIEIDWRDLDAQGGEIMIAGLRQRFVPMLEGGPHMAAAAQAIASFEALSRRGGFLALVPLPLHLIEVDDWLRRCSVLDRTPVDRLLRCPRAEANTDPVFYRRSLSFVRTANLVREEIVSRRAAFADQLDRAALQ